MLKKVLAYLLFVAFSIQIASNLLTIAAFELNRDYIAKNLCINRAKKGSHCNGKCHLMKEIQKNEKEGNSPGNSMKEKNEIVQYCSFAFMDFNIYQVNSIEIYFKFLNGKLNNPLHSIFQPPQT